MGALPGCNFSGPSVFISCAPQNPHACDLLERRALGVTPGPTFAFATGRSRRSLVFESPRSGAGHARQGIGHRALAVGSDRHSAGETR